MTEVLNPTKKHHFGGTPPKVVILGCDTKLKIKTSKNIEIWVQIPHVPQLLSEFFSPHLHQPWLSAGVQNALVCNCPKSMRWCFTCMFISWCKYWQRTIVDKSTYDKIYWKKGSTKIILFSEGVREFQKAKYHKFFAVKNPRRPSKTFTKWWVPFVYRKLHMFLLKNSWHHVIGHFEKHPLVHLIPLVFLTQSQTLGKKQHTLEK